MTTSNTPDQRIDIILDTFKNSTQGKQAIELAQSQLKSLFETMCTEIIGDDIEVPRPTDEETRARFYRASGQNFTRGQQRQRIPQVISKYFGGGEYV